MSIGPNFLAIYSGSRLDIFWTKVTKASLGTFETFNETYLRFSPNEELPGLCWDGYVSKALAVSGGSVVLTNGIESVTYSSPVKHDIVIVCPDKKSEFKNPVDFNDFSTGVNLGRGKAALSSQARAYLTLKQALPYIS